MRGNYSLRRAFSIGLCTVMLAQGCMTASAGEAGQEEVGPGRKTISMEQQKVDLEGVLNARQLGGYVGAEGRKIKNNVLLRTGALTRISEESVRQLSDLYHVKTVVDFRMDHERRSEPDREIPGAENQWVSVLEFDMTDPAVQKMMESMAELRDDKIGQMIEYAKLPQTETLYEDILMSESGQKGYARFFDLLSENQDGAVLWHCTHGKDRAGIASALLLYALGVDEAVIEQDFALSGEVYRQQAAYAEAEAKKRGCDEKTVENAKILASVSTERFRKAMDGVKEKYGSMDAYLKNQLEISDEQLAALRNRYLESGLIVQE